MHQLSGLLYSSLLTCVHSVCVSLLILQIERLSPSPGLDDSALDTIETSFQQFNVFLDLLRAKGYERMSCIIQCVQVHWMWWGHVVSTGYFWFHGIYWYIFLAITWLYSSFCLLCVCVCVCMCMHTHTRVCACVCIPTHVCVHVYAYPHTCVCMCMHTHTRVCACVCIPTRVCALTST